MPLRQYAYTMMTMSKLQHRLHALIYPADDVPGEWIAHCLDLDIVSQGTNAPHALEMLCEAIKLSVQWAIEENRPPLEMRAAPAEAWEKFESTPPTLTRILRLPSVKPEIVVETSGANACTG